ncbi:hypothetical protein BGX38DRAFT_1260034 [Terfezia claveryi]|nr:hypothetical protein BGX38DRAFT_1260034 [Terfezia claveryi]
MDIREPNHFIQAHTTQSYYIYPVYNKLYIVGIEARMETFLESPTSFNCDTDNVYGQVSRAKQYFDAGSDDAGSDDAGSDDAGSDNAGSDDAGSDDAGSDDDGLHFDAHFDTDSNNNQPYRKFSA